MSLDGVLANPNLVSFLNGLHGKQVLIETKAGQQFMGVFGASSPELEVGLTYAWLKTPENAKNILPKKDEIKEKMVFKFADIITISVVWSEEKNIKGFATDREYHNVKTNGRTDDEELEAWECENDDEIETDMPDQKQNYHKNGGWSVDEMFTTNSRLHGVQSTFDDDMSQYTTVSFEATEEEKARAEQIAREIEQSSRSKFYSRLENDDDERDLDKATNDDEHDSTNKRKSNNNSFVTNTGGRNRNDRGGPPNRRAEGLRSDRKSSGQQIRHPRHEHGNGCKQAKYDSAEMDSSYASLESSVNTFNTEAPLSVVDSQAAVSTSVADVSFQSPETCIEEEEEAAILTSNLTESYLQDEKHTDENQSVEKEKSGTPEISKKFAFNLNAAPFTPRQQVAKTSSQTGSLQQVPMGMVPGVQMQGAIPPGMVVPTGQPMIGPWHPGYVQVPTAPYQVYVPSQTMLGNMSMQGQGGNIVGNHYPQMVSPYVPYNGYVEVYSDASLQQCLPRGPPVITQAMGSNIPGYAMQQMPPAPPGFSRSGYYS